jgi:hypothetical protein
METRKIKPATLLWLAGAVYGVMLVTAIVALLDPDFESGLLLPGLVGLVVGLSVGPFVRRLGREDR